MRRLRRSAVGEFINVRAIRTSVRPVRTSAWPGRSPGRAEISAAKSVFQIPDTLGLPVNSKSARYGKRKSCCKTPISFH